MTRRLIILTGIVVAAAAALWLVLGSPSREPAEPRLDPALIPIPAGYIDPFDPEQKRGFLGAVDRLGPRSGGLVEPLADVTHDASTLARFCFMPHDRVAPYEALQVLRLTPERSREIRERFRAECGMRLYRVAFRGRVTFTAVYRLPGRVPPDGAVIDRMSRGKLTLVLRALPASVPLAEFDARAHALASQP
ncbi:MAG TPA: hypothetical protein VEA15_11700 [Caulobacteraceae bacterium]|nr:hypothetical protein [Caulobacteraceae bacterium]